MFKKLFGGGEKEGEQVEQVKKPILEPFHGDFDHPQSTQTENGKGSEQKEKEAFWSYVPGLKAEHLVLTMCKQREVKILVPDLFDGKRVKELRHSFCGHPDLEEVVVPEGVKVLGSGVFENCPKLTTVTLPSTLQRMASGVFVNCPQLKTLHWTPQPDLAMDKNVFQGTPELFDANGLLIHKGVWLASDGAKIGSTFVAPEEVEVVGVRALDSIASLDHLTLSYDTLPFYHTQETLGVILPKVKVLVLRGTSRDKSLSPQYSFCCKPEKVVLWEGLEVMEEGALKQCGSLTTISLPQSLKTIQDKAFAHCSKLTEITIPKGVKRIEKEVFQECEALESIEFESEEEIKLGLKAILYYKNMIDVPKIVLESWPATVREAFLKKQILSWGKFSKATKEKCKEKLNNPFVKATLVRICAEELEGVHYLEKGEVPFCSAMFKDNDLDLIYYYLKLNVLTKKEHIDYLLEQAVEKENTEVTALLLEYKKNLFSPEELMAQEERDFELEMGVAKPTRKELEKNWVVVEKKDGLMIRDYIGKGGEGVLPFLTEDEYMILGIEGREFEGLRSLIIERGVVRISGRFKDLESIHIGSGVSGFPADTFGMSALYSLKLPDTVLQLGRGFANRCQNLEEVELSPNIHTMHQECFAYCKELERVVFPEKLRHIGAGCFAGTKITKVDFAPTVTYIGEGAFMKCHHVTEVVLPAGLQELGAKAFSNCNSLKKVILPRELDSLGVGAFELCSVLEYVGYKDGKNLLEGLRKQGIVT